MKPMKHGLKVSLLTTAVLLLGGLSTVSQHDLFSYKLENGDEFNYPNFPNFLMFLSMSCIGFFWLYSVKKARKMAQAYLYKELEHSDSERVTESNGLVSNSDIPRNNSNNNVGIEISSSEVHMMRNESSISLIPNFEDVTQVGEVNQTVGHIDLSPSSTAADARAENTESQKENQKKGLRCGKKRCSSKWLNNPYVALIFSAIFDLIASTLGSVALSPTCNVPSSVYQLLQAALVPFTTLLSICFLKAKFKAHHWIGVAVVILGLALVAVSSYLVSRYFAPENDNEEEDKSSGVMLALGIILILIAQLVYALQFILEEFSMKACQTLPSQVVCVEGVYGLGFTLILVWPILYGSRIENDYEAFEFIRKKPQMIVQIVIFFLVIMFYNLCGQMLTQTASAAHRTIVEAMRSAVVWIMSLLEYAMWPTDDVQWGEKFYSWASAVQLIGFIILTIGSLTYYDVIKWRNFCKCNRNKHRKITEDMLEAPPKEEPETVMGE